MGWFVKSLVSPVGRGLRIAAGVAFIVGGLLGLSGLAGIVVAVIGLVPLLAGAVDVCIFAPLFGYHLSGARTRAAV